MPTADRDAALAAELDDLLDALAAGASAPVASEEAVALVATARRVERLANLAGAWDLGSAAPTWEGVAGSARAVEPVPPVQATAARPRPTSRGRWHVGLGEVATATLLVLLLIGGFALFSGPGRAPRSIDTVPVMLYRSDPDRLGLIPLDPVSLLDDPAGTRIPAATPVPEDPAGAGRESADTWLASVDGSTVVALLVSDPRPGMTAVVFDLPSGRERIRFALEPGGAMLACLTTDGSRLIVEDPQERPPDSTMLGAPPRWAVYDTTTGQVVRTIVASRPAPGFESPSGVPDPAGERLYALSVADPDWSSSPGPWPVRLVEYDLATGAEARAVELPGITGGVWTVADPSNERYSLIFNAPPAIALSPDGRTLAVVNGDGSSVAFVATADLSVTRTVQTNLAPDFLAVSPPPSDATPPLPSGFSWEPDPSVLGALTRIAMYYPVFTPDGRLLVSGFVGGEVANFSPDLATVIPATIVDPDDGSVVQPGGFPAGIHFLPRQPAGPDLYLWSVLAPQREADDPGLMHIYRPAVLIARLDPDTFEIRSSRTFEGVGSVVVIPSRRQ